MNSPIGSWQHRYEGGAERGDWREMRQLDPRVAGSAHYTGKPRGSGWDSGRTKLPNPRAPRLPRCLPTPTEEADGNGYGAIAGRGGPSRPPPRASVNLVPLLLTGVRLHPPRRTDKHLRRCFGAPGRGFSLITLITFFAKTFLIGFTTLLASEEALFATTSLSSSSRDSSFRHGLAVISNYELANGRST